MARAVRETRVSRHAGLDSLFVGDHHLTGAPYYQNSPILGRRLAEWGERTCGALYLLALWHPVLWPSRQGRWPRSPRDPSCSSARSATVPASSPRCRSPCASAGRGSRACLDIVRRLLAGEEVSADGAWPLVNARTGPRPPQPVEVWIAAGAEASIDRAARVGISSSCGQVVVLVRQSRRTFVEGLDFVTTVGHGREPGDRERLPPGECTTSPSCRPTWSGRCASTRRWWGSP